MPSPIHALHRAVGALAACILACAAPPSARDGGAIRVVDDAGDTVRLERPAHRIASLNPVTTELLFAIGAGDAVHGRTPWCDYPARAAAVPVVGDPFAPNIEALVASGPDLVVLYQSPRNAEAASRLRQLGIPVVQLRTDRIDQFIRTARMLGVLTGSEDSAEAMLGRFERELAQVTRPNPEGPRVLIVGWDSPPMIIGAGSFLHDLVERAGARNVFGDISTPDAPMSLEAIAARAPAMILTASDAPRIAARPEWRSIPAVRERRFLRIQGSEFSRPSPRLPAAIRQLAARLDSLAGLP